MSEARSPRVKQPQPLTAEAWRTLVGGLESQVEALAQQVDKLRTSLADLAGQSEAIVGIIVQAHATAPVAPIEAPTAEAEPDLSEEERELEREEVHRQVEQLRAELATGRSEDGLEGEREDFAVTAQQEPAEDAAGAFAEREQDGEAPLARGEETAAPVSAEEEDEREKVRRAVEQVRVEMAASLGSGFSDEAFGEPREAAAEGAATGEHEEARREEVRRAVERARADLSGGPATAEPVREALNWTGVRDTGLTPPPTEDRRPSVGAPIIVIDDPEGRVELVQVYQMLNRVGSAGTAVLMNYTHHSVTIGINSLDLPPSEQVAAAVQSVFGRACKTQMDGNRMTVRIGSEQSSVA